MSEDETKLCCAHDVKETRPGEACIQIKFSSAAQNAALLNQGSPAAQQGRRSTGLQQGYVETDLLKGLKVFCETQGNMTCSTC